MNQDELVQGIESKLRGLRSCDTQASAVAWMKGAYLLMEECLTHLKEKPAPGGLIFPPKLQVVQSIPSPAQLRRELRAAEAEQERHRRALQERSHSQTVVYPEVFSHPGLAGPKAWTHRDTLRLERAVKTKIQKAGK